MKNLILCEWKRLWMKKTTWLCFLSIPFILVLSLKYYIVENTKLQTNLPEFTSFANFPTAALQEQLMSVFNIIVILLVVLSITEEYRTGQLRMILTRSFNLSEIFVAKIVVIVLVIFLFLMSYFILSIPAGYFVLPRTDNVMLFFHTSMSSIPEVFSYNLAYYTLAFFTLIAFASVIIFLAVVNRTNTGAVASSIAFLLVSFIYPNILNIFTKKSTTSFYTVMFSSIPYIQFKGIAIMLSVNYINGLFFLLLIPGTIIIYAALFIFMAFKVFVKEDYLM